MALPLSNQGRQRAPHAACANKKVAAVTASTMVIKAVGANVQSVPRSPIETGIVP